MVKRVTDLDGGYSLPELLFFGDLLDRACRTYLPAEDARWFAVPDPRDENGRPQTFDPRFEEGRVERVVRANFHALRASNAPFEERPLLDRARRTDDARVVVGVERVGGARGRDGDGARGDRSEGGATAGVGH